MTLVAGVQKKHQTQGEPLRTRSHHRGLVCQVAEHFLQADRVGPERGVDEGTHGERNVESFVEVVVVVVGRTRWGAVKRARTEWKKIAATALGVTTGAGIP